MKTIEVGAFQAKTNLSRLLDEVEKGAVVRISRRGKPVAVLKADESATRTHAVQALEVLRGLCDRKVPLSEVTKYRDTGRER